LCNIPSSSDENIKKRKEEKRREEACSLIMFQYYQGGSAIEKVSLWSAGGGVILFLMCVRGVFFDLFYISCLFV